MEHEFRIDRRELLKRGGGLALATGMTGALAGCFGDDDAETTGPTASGTPPSRPTGTLKVSLPSNPDFIDPSAGFGIPDFLIFRNVFDGLVNWNQDNSELVPALATRWESSDDAREWIFHLRTGVTFHDGEPFDSTAVKKTAEYYADRELGFFWVGPKEIDDSDPAVVRVMYDAPAPDLAKNQTLIRMLSPKVVAGGPEEVETNAIGCGAFKLGKLNRGGKIVLTANEDFWDEGPYVEQLELTPIADDVSRFSALQSGVVDLVLNVPPTQLESLESDSQLASDSVVSWTDGDLSLDCSSEPTNDVRVRQAIAHAVDKDAIVETILRGQATRLDTPVPEGTYGYAVPSVEYPFDPDRARKLLSEAGYPNGVEVEIAVFAGIRVLGEQVMQAVTSMLNDVGIRGNLDIMDPGVIGGEVIGGTLRHQVVHLENGWVNGAPNHLSNGNLLTQARYTGKELTNLISEMTTTTDGPKRLALMRDVQELFMEELPHVPLYQLTLTTGYRREVQGFNTPKDGYMPYFGNTYVA